MKFVRCPLLFLFFTGSVFAQGPILNKGKIISDSQYSYVNSVFGNDETGYYTFSENKFKPTLEKYDLSFNKLVSTKLQLTDDNFKDRDEQLTFFYTNNIYVISTSYNKSTKVRSIFTETLDKKTLSSNKNVTKICEFTVESADAFCTVKLSDDHSKVLILQNTGNKYTVCVHSPDKMQPEYVEEFGLNLNKLNQYVNCFVTNSGNAVLYTYEFVNAESSKNYDAHLYLLTKSGKEKSSFPVSLQSSKASEIAVKEYNNSLIFAGFYSNGDLEKVNGCFYVNFDLNSMKAGDVKTSKFSSEYSDQNIDHLLLLPDGGLLFLGEKSNHFHHVNESKTYPGAPVTYNSPVNVITGQREQAGSNSMRTIKTTSDSYQHGNILVVNFDKNGTVRWTDEIRKRQFFTVPGNYGYSYLMFASYTTALTGDKIHLIFNDHINNLPKKEESMDVDFQRKAPGALIDVAINLSDGSYSKTAIEKFEFSKDNIIYRPSGALHISPNEIVMFGSNEENHQGVDIKF